MATYARPVAVSDLKRHALSAVALAGGALALAVPAGAQAAFPGANGKFVFVTGTSLETIEPDGTGGTVVTNTAGAKGTPQ